MDSELLLKFIEHFPDYLSALSRTLLRFFWTTFVETAVYAIKKREAVVLFDLFTVHGQGNARPTNEPPKPHTLQDCDTSFEH